MTFGDKVFQIIVILLMLFVGVVTLYPVYYVLVGSFSNAHLLSIAKGLTLWPQGFDLSAYRVIFKNAVIWRAYANTVFYSVLGTALNVLLTTMGAYSLSRKNLIGSKVIMRLLVFTMYFSGGLIPTYMIMDSLGLVDNWLVMVIPGAISVYNLIVLRTSFLTFPKALEEAAIIDGAGPVQVLIRVVIPVIMPTLMVITLWYFVGHWNAYYDAMIYLRNIELYPLQLVLRNMLIDNDLGDMSKISSSSKDVNVARTIKYAVIVVALAPVLVIYPFIQKYFVKGVMVGSIKE